MCYVSGMILTEKTEVLGQEAVPMPVLPLQFSHGLARHRTGPRGRETGDKPAEPRDKKVKVFFYPMLPIS